jgi:broad specificity phosphatase PhoE
MMNEIWLIRHGETAWSVSGQHTSRTDLPLTDQGRHRAAELRRMLGAKQFTLVLASPKKRALDTCTLAGYSPEVTEDLCEWDYGEYEGLTTAEIQKSSPGWSIWTGVVPGGETVDEVAARADRVIARVGSAAGDVALFGHGHFSRVLAARWVGLGGREGRLLALSTGSVSVLGHERATRVIQVWNRTE